MSKVLVSSRCLTNSKVVNSGRTQNRPNLRKIRRHLRTSGNEYWGNSRSWELKGGVQCLVLSQNEKSEMEEGFVQKKKRRGKKKEQVLIRIKGH